MRISRKLAIAVLGMALSVPVFSQNPKQDQPDADTFCADLRLPHPTAVPKKVLNLILSRKEIEESVDEEARQSDPARFFHATEVRLGPTGEIDLLVIGGGPFSGADNDWFWLVRFPYRNPEIVLWEGANCISLDQNRTNGLRNVSSSWSSASQHREVTFRFDGTKYRAGKERWSQVRP